MTEENEVNHLDKLIMLGYRVEQAHEVEGTTVWFVEGFGMSTYVRGDDEESLASLADEQAHAEREKQHSETPEETQLRWHDDPDNEYELPEEQVNELRERVATMKPDNEEENDG